MPMFVYESGNDVELARFAQHHGEGLSSMQTLPHMTTDQPYVVYILQLLQGSAQCVWLSNISNG